MKKFYFNLNFLNILFLNKKVCFILFNVAVIVSSFKNQSQLLQKASDSKHIQNLNSCKNCAKVDEKFAIKLKIDAIQKQILSKLKLKEVPKVTSSNIPKGLIEEALNKLNDEETSAIKSNLQNFNLKKRENFLFEKNNVPLSNQDFDVTEDYYGKHSELIIFPEPGKKINGHTLLDLSLSNNNIDKLEVMSAYLWIYLRLHPTLYKQANRNLKNQNSTLYIFKVKNNLNQNFDFEKITSIKLPTNESGWKKIDLKEAIQKWFKSSTLDEQKLTLLVNCSGCDSLIQIVLFSFESESKADEKIQTMTKFNLNEPRFGLRPILIINTALKPRERSKRNVITCSGKVKQCCKNSLYVNFTEIGWEDWVIQPNGYFANYCVGDCSYAPTTPDVFASFYSQILEQYRRKNPLASISPCCVPTRLSSMTLLYFGQNNSIIKTDLPNMVVEECGCT